MAGATRVMPILSVERMEPALRFYRDRLGGEEVIAQPPGGEKTFVGLRYGASYLGIASNKRPKLHDEPMQPVSGHRLELRFNVDDVDAVLDQLIADGIEVIAPVIDQDWGERSAFVRDPDGNIVMLATPATLA